MRRQISNYTTPQKRQFNRYSNDKNNTTTVDSKSKYIPIFQNEKKKLGRIFNIDHLNFQRQKISQWEIINFDFCGCENGITPCDIIIQNFLKNVSLTNMKQSYTSQTFKLNLLTPQITNFDKKELFKILPKNYPETYFSHLNNLVQIIGLSRYQQPQFLCLYSIQYHSKVQYLTYYLYQDMKNYYSKYDHFLNELDDELLKLNSTRSMLHQQYNVNFLSINLNKFIAQYFDSIGANLIPLPYYSKFMAVMFKKGKSFMVRILAKFIVQKRKQLEQGLIYLRSRDLQKYRTFMRQLNFQGFIQQGEQ